MQFSLPLFFGNLLQQCYNLADTAIAGHLLGDAALAQIGATAALYSLIMNFAFGLNNGMALTVSRSFGAGDEKKMRQDFLEQLKLLIDFDAADFYLSSDTDSFRRTYTFSLCPISRRSGKKRKRKRTEPPRVKNSIDLTKFATE